jgi:tRNA (mo5U34)-methyltransferase
MTKALHETGTDGPQAWSRADIEAAVRRFPFWYQRIELAPGLFTLPQLAYHELVWQRVLPALPADLRGASVLDVGCNAGYFAIEAKRRGAGRVVGIESVGEFLRQAELCRDVLGLDIEYVPMDAHAIRDLRERFDLVVFTGILYHLKDPLHVIEAVGECCGDAVIVESEVLADDPRTCVYVRQGPHGQTPVTPVQTGIMKFLERDDLNGDPSNWWVPDVECVRGMLRTAGFSAFSRPVMLQETRVLLAATKRTESRLDLSRVA